MNQIKEEIKILLEALEKYQIKESVNGSFFTVFEDQYKTLHEFYGLCSLRRVIFNSTNQFVSKETLNILEKFRFKKYEERTIYWWRPMRGTSVKQVQERANVRIKFLKDVLRKLED